MATTEVRLCNLDGAILPEENLENEDDATAPGAATEATTEEAAMATAAIANAECENRAAQRNAALALQGCEARAVDRVNDAAMSSSAKPQAQSSSRRRA